MSGRPTKPIKNETHTVVEEAEPFTAHLDFFKSEVEFEEKIRSSITTPNGTQERDRVSNRPIKLKVNPGNVNTVFTVYDSDGNVTGSQTYGDVYDILYSLYLAIDND